MIIFAGHPTHPDAEPLVQRERVHRLFSYASPWTKVLLKYYLDVEAMGKLTFASHTQYGPEGEQIMLAEKVHRLFSYASPQTKPLLPLYASREVSLYLDSGAYSVFTKGVVLSLDEYCTFIQNTRDIWSLWFNLDVIPGAPGRPATPAEGLAAARASLDNWRAMRRRGLPSVPVFHMGEPIELLDEIRDEVLSLPHDEHGIIALGGLAMAPVQARFEWLRDTAWPRLLKSDGTPRIKVHGLGITDQLTATTFPWYSIDSSSWIRWVIAGRMAYWRDGKLYALPVSERHRVGWHHYSDHEKNQLREVGDFPKDFESWPVKEQYLYITQLNVRAVKQLEAMIPTKVQSQGVSRKRMW